MPSRRARATPVPEGTSRTLWRASAHWLQGMDGAAAVEAVDLDSIAPAVTESDSAKCSHTHGAHALREWEGRIVRVCDTGVSHRSGQGTLWPSTGSDAIGVFLTRVVADQQLPFASRHQTLAKERADRGVPGRAVRRRAVDRLRRGALALVDHPGPPRASAARSVRDRHGSDGLDEQAFYVHCRSFRPRLTAWNAAWLCRRAIPLPKTDGARAGGTGAVALGNGTNSPPAEIRPKDGVPPGSQID